MTRRLDSEQRERFRQAGYLIFPRLVPAEHVNAALRAIHQSLAGGLEPKRMAQFRSRTFFPELSDSLVMRALTYESEAMMLAEELVGARLLPHGGTQIALRFPSAEAEASRMDAPHIDGMYTPTNGVKKGTIASFTLLIGVALSDVVDERSGNFTVWPGSHLALAAHFETKGTDSLLRGMPALNLGEPHPLKLRAGDVVLAHYLLAHAVAPHAGPHIRYMTFNRLEVAANREHRWDAMQDPWRVWPAMCT